MTSETKVVRVRSKKQIQRLLEELQSPGFRRSHGCSMGYEHAATIDTLRWVLGLRESPPLAGRR